MLAYARDIRLNACKPDLLQQAPNSSKLNTQGD